ncbi:phosphotransferase family protein [Actinophytocola glycyrrhizae]|uniref:Phosphotransferase family protein n=1 Tax=Actinophytocola glycyrrhizae TaxID=2044873 RepID=A0ABV9SF53_9PSEU
MSISTQAAVTVATSLGVPCDDPVVLQDGSNVVVHLRPSPVVARVATLTADVRPGVEAWLTRDIAVATHLAAHGVAATVPLSEPVEVAGAVAVLWRYEPHDPASAFSPATMAERLASLHAALDSFDGELPRLAPCADLDRALALADLPPEVTARLAAANDRLREALSTLPVRPLHGDAHPGNLLATPSGPVWNDFEDTWLGPLGWDLACLLGSGRVDGAAAVAAYPGPYSRAELSVCAELRELFGVVWRFVLARRFPDHRADADTHLREWLSRPAR